MLFVTETIYLLQMTSPDELVSASGHADEIQLHDVSEEDAPVVRSIYARIGAPLDWGGRMAWTEAQWMDELSKPGVRAWIAVMNAETAGLVELESEANGDVGIVVLGLVPEFVGRGFGGLLLTAATRLAWQFMRSNIPQRRVWVQTSSRDHPHALPNYKARGFRVVGTEQRS
jgi:GNAT superfamily N-acetyltransferase